MSLLQPEQLSQQAQAEKRQKFLTWVRTSFKTLESRLNALTTTVRSNVQAIQGQQQSHLELIQTVERLADGMEVQSKKFEALATAHAETVAKLNGFLDSYQKEHAECSHSHLVEYVEGLVKDLGSAKQGDGGMSGANIVGFDMEGAYDKGTIGYAVKGIIRSLAQEATFFNLGYPKDVLAEETVKVTQTYITLFNPKDALPGVVSTIEGGSAHDMLLIGFRGTVKFALTGNIHLRSPFEATETSMLALRKVDNRWKEVWRGR